MDKKQTNEMIEYVIQKVTHQFDFTYNSNKEKQTFIYFLTGCLLTLEKGIINKDEMILDTIEYLKDYNLVKK